MEKFDVPVPTQEKVGRWLTWGVLGVAVIFGGKFLLPHVNQFLGLVEIALATTTNIVVSGFCLMVLAYLIMTFAPTIKQGIDVFAERTTWALVNADPVGHLRVWLKEVQADKQEFANQLEGIGQAIGTVEASMARAGEDANKAQSRYNSAMRSGNANTQSFSVAAGKYSDSVKRYEKMLGPLKMLERELQKLFAVYEREEFSLATDIDIQSKEWEVAQRAGAALDSAFRFLTKKSKKQVFAEQASKVISDRYASQFGRLRTLKNMSHDLIETFNLETGEYDAIAYEKWQQQSALVVDSRSGKLEQVPMATVQAAKAIPRF